MAIVQVADLSDAIGTCMIAQQRAQREAGVRRIGDHSGILQYPRDLIERAGLGVLGMYVEIPGH